MNPGDAAGRYPTGLMNIAATSKYTRDAESEYFIQLPFSKATIFCRYGLLYNAKPFPDDVAIYKLKCERSSGLHKSAHYWNHE